MKRLEGKDAIIAGAMPGFTGIIGPGVEEERLCGIKMAQSFSIVVQHGGQHIPARNIHAMRGEGRQDVETHGAKVRYLHLLPGGGQRFFRPAHHNMVEGRRFMMCANKPDHIGNHAHIFFVNGRYALPTKLCPEATVWKVTDQDRGPGRG